MSFLKVNFHCPLLQNVGGIPRVVQYILELVIYPVACTSPPPSLYGFLPSPSLHLLWLP